MNSINYTGDVSEEIAIRRLRIRLSAFHFYAMTMGKLFTHTCTSVTKQYFNLVVAKLCSWDGNWGTRGK